MAKIKYDPETFPILAEGYARQGLNDEQIFTKLGISKDSFYRYQNKYSDFSDAIKRGKAPIDFEVENLLLKKVRGYEYEESSTEVKVSEVMIKDLGLGEKTTKVIRKTTKHIAPDLGAIIFWLCNRMRHIWQQTTRIEIDTLPDDFQKIFKNMSTKRLEHLLGSDLTKFGKVPSKKTNHKKSNTPGKKTTPIKSGRRNPDKESDKNRAGTA